LLKCGRREGILFSFFVPVFSVTYKHITHETS
jgi:hypothetical protein